MEESNKFGTVSSCQENEKNTFNTMKHLSQKYHIHFCVKEKKLSTVNIVQTPNMNKEMRNHSHISGALWFKIYEETL